MRYHRHAIRGIGMMLFLGIAGTLFAEEHNDASWWNLKVGSKAVYSTGLTETYTYYTLFGEGSMDLNVLKIAANGSRDFSSQVSSGFGEYQYIGVNRASVKLEIMPFEFLSAGGGYYAGRGDSSYKLKEWDAFLRIGPDAFNLEGAYGASNSQYLFNGTEIEVTRKNVSIALSGDITDELSLDVSYERSALEFSNLTYAYVKNTFRAGAFFEVNDAFFLTGGLSGGSDTADYVIVGADAGIIVVLFSRIRVSGMYFFEQYIAPSPETTANSPKGGGGTGKSSSGGNPYVKSSNIGESFPSHRVSISIVYSLH